MAAHHGIIMMCRFLTLRKPNPWALYDPPFQLFFPLGKLRNHPSIGLLFSISSVSSQPTIIHSDMEEPPIFKDKSFAVYRRNATIDRHSSDSLIGQEVRICKRDYTGESIYHLRLSVTLRSYSIIIITSYRPVAAQSSPYQISTLHRVDYILFGYPSYERLHSVAKDLGNTKSIRRKMVPYPWLLACQNQPISLACPRLCLNHSITHLHPFS